LWPLLGQVSPSREGLLSGLLGGARLMVMLMFLQFLVLALPRERLLAGIHGLLHPLARLGLDPDRASLRLSLTLLAMERRPGPHVFRDLLAGRAPGHDLPVAQILHVYPRTRLDGFALILALGLAGVLWCGA